MSLMGLLGSGAFGLLAVWGIAIGIKGAFADMPPNMKGERGGNRFDERLNKAA